MDSENNCSILECVEDNEGIVSLSAAKNMEIIGQHNIRNNGSCVVESDDCEESFSEVAGKKIEGSGTLNLLPVESVPGLSPSSTMTRKWSGLKKWRRIKRDSNKIGDGSVDTTDVVALDKSDSGLNPSKRMQIFSERKQKSQGSVSSMIATVRSLDDFTLLGHSGTDMENGEIWSSKSSTEVSLPKTRGETSGLVEFSPDKIRVRSYSGTKFSESTPRGQQEKSRILTSKKSRGEKVNIEKVNSHSSVESDVRSTNFLFMQGSYSTSNGIQSKRSTDYDGENANEVQGIQQSIYNGLKDGEEGYEDISPEHVSDDLSREVEGGSQNNGSSMDPDLQDECIFNLESVKEALEEELVKFREIRQDVLVNDTVGDLPAEFSNDDQNPREISSESSQSSEGMQRLSFAPRSEVLETENRDLGTEIEDLFMQKIKAEVEYIALSRTVQNLRVAVVDHQITFLDEQKTLASKQTQILNKLGDTEKKAVMLNKEAEKLEKFCEDITSVDETMKLQNRVYKYTTFFFMQLVTLVLVFGIFVFQLSPKYVEDVPT